MFNLLVSCVRTCFNVMANECTLCICNNVDCLMSLVALNMGYSCPVEDKTILRSYLTPTRKNVDYVLLTDFVELTRS